jgi:hypothetical protein
MSDIKVGDLVRVVWGCCERHRQAIGWVGTVEAIEVPKNAMYRCGYVLTGICARVTLKKSGLIPISWLIRIDPPAETTEHEKEMAI